MMASERLSEYDQRLTDLLYLAQRIAEAEAVAAIRGDSRLVFGTGNPMTSLVLIGEAPGADEEKQGRPFVGRAGRLLDDALERAGISRSDIWITNVVKIRPTKPGANDRRRNRPPTTDEKNTFRPWLEEELRIIAPRAIVCVGATAAAALLGRKVKITAERGQWTAGPGGARVLTTYHPAYLLRPFRDRDERFQHLIDDLRLASQEN